jgi:LysR family transcriptional regulator, glycine cleavage system transcriptional activator
MSVKEPLPIDLPDVESLRCFLAAMKAPTFRAAAREVALTPAALGQRIKLLEERLDVKLFSRTTRRVTATEAALAVRPAAERCLEAAADCVRLARGTGERPRVELVVGTRDELGRSWLVPQLAGMRTALPWLRMHLYFGSGPDLLVRVRTAEIDCAITSTRFADPRLDAFVLHEERYAFVGAPKLLQKKPLRSPADAEAHVLLDAGADMPLFRYFREGKGAPSMRFGDVTRLGAIGPIKHETVHGAGVAVLPLYFVEPELKARKLVRLFPKVESLSDHFRLVFRAGDPRRATFESLATELRATPLR